MNPCLFTELGIAYQQAYSGPYEVCTLRNGPATMFIGRKDKMLSGFGRPAICYGSSYMLTRDFTELYYQTPRVWYMDLLEDGAITEITKFLVKQGRTPQVVYTQVIDLSVAEPELHRAMNKSYQNLANKYDVGDVTVDDLRAIHRQVTGRATRNDDTWKLQQQMVDAGQAFCLGGPMDNVKSAALFLHNGTWCYYGVAATIRDEVCEDGHAWCSHPVIWKGILRAKQLGCRWMELGEQTFYGDEKQAGISKFKRGFGGKAHARLEFR